MVEKARSDLLQTNKVSVAFPNDFEDGLGPKVKVVLIEPNIICQ